MDTDAFLLRRVVFSNMQTTRGNEEVVWRVRVLGILFTGVCSQLARPIASVVWWFAGRRGHRTVLFTHVRSGVEPEFEPLLSFSPCLWLENLKKSSLCTFECCNSIEPVNTRKMTANDFSWSRSLPSLPVSPRTSVRINIRLCSSPSYKERGPNRTSAVIPPSPFAIVALVSLRTTFLQRFRLGIEQTLD